MSKIVPVILCGGSGTRLWPKSRPERPKPFLPLLGRQSLFAETLGRMPADAGFDVPLVVTGESLRPLVEAELAGRGCRLIVEPTGRNTAPAIALAAHRLPPDAVMLVCPSDHHIGEVSEYHAAAVAAADLAREGFMVAIGVTPSHPETGYGYIRRGAKLSGGFVVERFVEKPHHRSAEAYLAERNYSWNAGIFAFTAGSFLKELATHRPEMAEAVARAVEAGSLTDDVFTPDPELFAAVSKESVDYAVMEHTEKAAVVPADMAWSDIGSWSAVQQARGGDAQGNRAPPNAELVDCRNVLVESDGPRVSVIGLEDVIVVVDGNEVLVTSADGAQLVGSLKGAQGE